MPNPFPSQQTYRGPSARPHGLPTRFLGRIAGGMSRGEAEELWRVQGPSWQEASGRHGSFVLEGWFLVDATGVMVAI